MDLIFQSENLEDYLEESKEINFSDSSIQQLIGTLFDSKQSLAKAVGMPCEHSKTASKFDFA